MASIGFCASLVIRGHWKGDSQLNHNWARLDFIHLHEGKAFCAGKPLLGFVMLEFEEDGRSCRQQINQQNRNCVTLRLLMTVLQHIVTFFYAVRRPLACCLTFELLEAVKLHCKFIDFFRHFLL